MTKSILTSIALSALIVPFFSNASEVATVSPTVTPVTFAISVELPAPSIGKSPSTTKPADRSTQSQ